MSIKLKPHLEEINRFYEQIKAFEAEVALSHRYDPIEREKNYSPEDAEAVLEAFNSSFKAGEEEEMFVKEALRNTDTDLLRLCECDSGIPEEESRLIYLFGRPFYHALKKSAGMDGIYWENGRCPVCSAVPSLSAIEKEAKRIYGCSFCGTEGRYLRIGCPKCGNFDSRQITIVTLEGEEGMRADVCESCRSYVKTFEVSMLGSFSFEELDIMSVAFDIVLQEKGYMRCTPNPVGIRRF